MKRSIAFVICICFIMLNANCDTVPGRFENQKRDFRTPWSEIKPDIVPLIETKGYNQVLVSVGLLSVLVFAGGFTYILIKKKHHH